MIKESEEISACSALFQMKGRLWALYPVCSESNEAKWHANPDLSSSENVATPFAVRLPT